MIAALQRLATNPLVRPSQIPFTRASGTFNPGAQSITRAVAWCCSSGYSRRRRADPASRWRCRRMGGTIDEIWDRPAIAREAPYEEWGVEDARITYLADEGRYAITYTGYSPDGPRVCLITTDDLLAPERYRPSRAAHCRRQQELRRLSARRSTGST